jgi:ribosomal protein L14
VCVVKKAKPVPQTLTGPAAQNRLRKGDIRHGVVVRVKAPVQRPDGSVIKFDDNAVVLLNKGTTEPVGTRISSVIAREVKEKGFAKIVTLAPRTV